MSWAKRNILFLVITLGGAFPSWALHAPAATNLAEINHHQAAATTALVMGDHVFLEQGEFAFSAHGHLSGWGADAIYGAWGLSLQARPWARWGIGLSYGFTAAQLSTRSWLLNAQFAALPEPDSWLQFQAALGHQFLDASERGNVLIRQFDYFQNTGPDNPQILLQDMNWTHGFLAVQAQARWWKLWPQASLGIAFSHYSWSGFENGIWWNPEQPPGPEISASGNSDTVVGTLGLGLDLGSARPFAGLKMFSGGALFLARLTIVF